MDVEAQQRQWGLACILRNDMQCVNLTLGFQLARRRFLLPENKNPCLVLQAQVHSFAFS